MTMTLAPRLVVCAQRLRGPRQLLFVAKKKAMSASTTYHIFDTQKYTEEEVDSELIDMTKSSPVFAGKLWYVASPSHLVSCVRCTCRDGVAHVAYLCVRVSV
jgi:hypothetical protein